MNAFLKKNKALLILPLALLPFVILIFYILGGGEHANSGRDMGEPTSGRGQTGANYKLPEADRSIEIRDKMEAYQNTKDLVVSTQDYHIRGNYLPKNEDVSSLASEDSVTVFEDSISAEININVSNNLLAHIKNKEKQVRKELVENNQRHGGSQTVSPAEPVIKPKPEQAVRLQKTGIEELDKVFNENISLNRANDSLSFHLKQTNQKLKELEERQTASFELEKEPVNGFGNGSKSTPLIKVEVYETTTVLNGNRVKLRLLEDCRVNGNHVSKNTFLYGVCQIKHERLQIRVRQLPIDESFLPVDLVIHDLDGLAGLYVPDNAARKVAKEVGSSTNTSSLFGVTADPLTYAGVRAADKTAQSLFKTIRLKKVTIKKNTLVYLVNQK
ncbi:conjugative transposon protein TraM [Sunxiuqinia indica]|uniref:conjugative transposon protein TraM n=1 Tax=Sunxiuqinia indica TaxID=2692584 RepID=UPI00135B055C|nr:conjugative transposon protein TraM [Sunxiuqinia indica]